MKHKAVVLRKYKQENETLEVQVLGLKDEEARNASLKTQLAKVAMFWIFISFPLLATFQVKTMQFCGIKISLCSGLRSLQMHRLQAENSELEGKSPFGTGELSSGMKRRIATRRPSNENIWIGDESKDSPVTSSIRAPGSLPLESDSTVIPAGDSTTKALHALGEKGLVTQN